MSARLASSASVFGVLLTAIIIGIVLSASSYSTIGSASTVRDNLKTLYQMQATAFAIVISLSMATVQLAASAYSLRLFSSFRGNPWLWIVIFSYAGSIGLDLWLLTILPQPISDPGANLPIGYEWHIRFSYCLGFVAVILMIPYFYGMMRTLSPEKIVKELAGKIRPKSKGDQFQPINDIICASVVKYDYSTARVGMHGMNYQVMRFVRSLGDYRLSCPYPTSIDLLPLVGEIEPAKRFIEYLFPPLIERIEPAQKVAKYLLRKRRVRSRSKINLRDSTENMVQTYVLHLEELGTLFARKQEEALTFEVVSHLGKLGLALAERGYPRYAIDWILQSLAQIGRETIARRWIDTSEIVIRTSTIITDAAEIDESEAVPSIEDLSRKAIETWGIEILGPISQILSVIAHMGIRKKNDSAAFQAITSLSDVSVEAISKEESIGQGSESSISATIPRYLMTLGKASLDNDLPGAAESAALGLWTIGTLASRRGLALTVEECAWRLSQLKGFDQKVVDDGQLSLKRFDKDIESKEYYKEFVRMYKDVLSKGT